MTRRGWGRTIALTVLLAVAIGAFVAWWNFYLAAHTELTKALLWVGWRPGADATDILVRHLPDDYNGAIKALRKFGFVEGNGYAGAAYRRLPVPAPNDVNGTERGFIRHYNRILDHHDAVSLKIFHRRVVSPLRDTGSIHVYLLIKKDGSMRVSARKSRPKF